MTDSPTPLATVSQFNASAYADLATNIPPAELSTIMLEATRACESLCRRRLAPFTGLVESSRCDAGDIDESSMVSPFLLSPQSQMGIDYARAIGVTDLVRYSWVNEFPPLYNDLWSGSVTSISVYWPYQSSPFVVGPSMFTYFQDTGLVRYLVGTFVPMGSRASITYSGGYSTIPGDLARASRMMAAKLIIDELDPDSNDGGHDPYVLEEKAIGLLDPYMRDV